MSSRVPFLPLPDGTGPAVYEHGPFSDRGESTPGRTEEILLTDSRIYPGTERRIWIHVPAEVDTDQTTGFVIFQDGRLYLDPEGEVRGGIVLDNLHHAGVIPPTIGIFVNPGTRTGPVLPTTPRQRNLEYDAADDSYARFLIDEVLPVVKERRPLLNDPRRAVLCGGSSGGNASFTAAWHRPDVFGAAICCLSSFAQMPGGNPYPDLIPSSGKRDVRYFLQIGQWDLNHDQPRRNWFAENLRVAAALAEGGDEVRTVVGDGGHSPNHGGVILPDALHWTLR